MKKDLKTALKITIPIFFGYIFVGIAFGLLLSNAGYNFLWAMLISCVVYSGSLQFILIPFFINPVSIITVIVTSIAVSSRHMFYGISFIERFNKMGVKKWYMIFSLTDETYSILCSQKSNEKVYNNDRTFFLMSFLNQMYWVIGSVIGSLIGDIIPFNTKGIDFALTALFAVILAELVMASKKITASAVGILCGVICLFIFGADN
ncbi:MAG: AzlC family ABC transporter permease, partial [Eubacteriaceae bacterium]|nr:AzlC family ABC transporter permease [Eubacteriaceae bacterium]